MCTTLLNNLNTELNNHPSQSVYIKPYINVIFSLQTQAKTAKSKQDWSEVSLNIGRIDKKANEEIFKKLPKQKQEAGQKNISGPSK